MKKYAFFLLLGLTGCVVDFESGVDERSSPQVSPYAYPSAAGAPAQPAYAQMPVYAPQPAYWQNPELYYAQQPSGWDYAPALTYVQQPSGGGALQYQPVVVAQPIVQPASEQAPVILQHPSTRRLVRCGMADADCVASYEQQGYVPLSHAPYAAGAKEVSSPSDYPDASWRDNNNIPRW
ncbi:MAG: hypothetical protein PHX68_03965 [Alphaproteobacteria bacterium]|nr:hypothetical protein [Alphaproteobacteria bacterium]